MINILMMIILIIILFIIILLASGIKITLEYTKKGSKLKGCLKILILKKIKVYSLEYPSKKEEEKIEESEEKKETDWKKLFELTKPCFEYLLNYFKTALKSIKITKVQNHLIFGMDSYADTGEYIGIIWGFFAVLNSMHKSIKLSAEPVFTSSTLDGYGDNEIDIYLIKMVIPTIRLLLKKEIRDLIRGVMDEF